MAPPLLHLQNIDLTLGSQPLLNGAELAVGAGERICLVGRNGSGKSTLLKVAAEMIRPDGGKRFLQPGTTIRYLPQEPDLAGFATVLAYAEAGLGAQGDHHGEDQHRARALLEQLGLDPERSPVGLSGGEVRRAALARTLAPRPDLLLLDEPTNHLDLPAIEWLEAELRQMRSGIVLISHDRRLLEKLSRSVVWLDGGITRRMERGFAHFETWRDEVLENEEREHHKLGRQIAREEDWMRYGVTARRKRNMRRVGELADLRQRFRTDRRSDNSLKLATTETETSGKLVVVAEHIDKSHGGPPIVRDLTLRVLRGDRLGIVGPNGAGKTTLLNLLTGQSTPDAGQITIGSNLITITLDQQRKQLNPETTLSDTLTGGGGDQVEVAGVKRHVIGYMKDFLFRPEQARTPVGQLSGGERGRLALACALARNGNLLVLDEPTNDLDLETLDLLQEYLSDYPGTVLLVSHDRDFLDRVVTSTLASEGEGSWVDYAGGYSDMLIQRGTPLKEELITTKRAAKTENTPAAPRRKLSFKEKHALETLPGRMADLQKDIAQHQATLADPTLYTKNAKRFAEITEKLGTAQSKLAAAEEQWLELELLRETLEG